MHSLGPRSAQRLDRVADVVSGVAVEARSHRPRYSRGGRRGRWRRAAIKAGHVSKTVLKCRIRSTAFHADILSLARSGTCLVGTLKSGFQHTHLYTRWIASRAQHSTTLNTAMNKDAHTNNNTRIISQYVLSPHAQSTVLIAHALSLLLLSLSSLNTRIISHNKWGSSQHAHIGTLSLSPPPLKRVRHDHHSFEFS